MKRAQENFPRTSWRTGFAGIVIAGVLLISNEARAAAPQPQEQTEVQKSVPQHATITQQISVDFGNGIEPDALAVVYMLPPVYAEHYNVGLRILRRKGASEWSVAYEETGEINPDGDHWTLEKVKAASGQEGLVVVYYYSGAGTTTDWKLIAAVRGKFVALDPKPIRDKVLRERHSVFEGYNDVKSQRDMITETIAGYSEHQARCCPDKARIVMRVRFTGRSIKLDGVSEMPAASAR